MTKNTYTPLLINNEIVVVLNAPENTAQYFYHEVIDTCTRYPTLPEDAAYWESKLGVRMDRSDFLVDTAYAIPKKQDDTGDLWDEAEELIDERFKDTTIEFYAAAVTSFLKSNYSLKRKI